MADTRWCEHCEVGPEQDPRTGEWVFDHSLCGYDNWLTQCEALVPNHEVWTMLEGWPWIEAYDTYMPPSTAVALALVDTLAPRAAEVTYFTESPAGNRDTHLLG